MNLSQLLRPGTIRLDSFAASKEDLIRQAVDLFEADQVPADRSILTTGLLQREQVMSTGIGGGVALPHVQHRAVPQLAASFVRTGKGVDFDAIDGVPIRLVFTIVGPEERGGFLKILASISRMLNTGDLQRGLLRATTPEAIIESIRHEEQRLRI